MFRSHTEHFSNWGILFDDLSASDSHLTVRSLPVGIAERCRLDSRLLIELLRTEIWKQHSKPVLSQHHRLATSTSDRIEGEDKHFWLQKVHNCPEGIVELLNSRACRSAIMFNDELSTDQCRQLVRRLADCAFPFQCAHGRPSLVPLVDWKALGLGTDSKNVHGVKGFAETWTSWREAVKKEEELGKS